LRTSNPLIGDVRGLGVFWALDLVDDPERATGVDGCHSRAEEGDGRSRASPVPRETRIHVTPPCIVTPDEVAQALAIYDEAFTAVEATL